MRLVRSTPLLGACLLSLGALSGCGSQAPSAAAAAASSGPGPVVAAGSSVPGLQVALLRLTTDTGTATAHFRVTNAGSTALRSRVFGDPAVGGIDRQLGRDLGGAFLFDPSERALYAPLRSQDSGHTVQGDRVPADLAAGQTVEVSVTFQRPPVRLSTSASPPQSPSCSNPLVRASYGPPGRWAPAGSSVVRRA